MIRYDVASTWCVVIAVREVHRDMSPRYGHQGTEAELLRLENNINLKN